MQLVIMLHDSGIDEKEYLLPFEYFRLCFTTYQKMNVKTLSRQAIHFYGH